MMRKKSELPEAGSLFIALLKESIWDFHPSDLKVDLLYCLIWIETTNVNNWLMKGRNEENSAKTYLGII